uniref:Uncharacterized protein n=1 Tax=Timema cristinae TaxID=61476 RepID=A0A7R9DNZ7_TIMCR|nr:unnamed protein product [Timema cristinae]
MVARGAGKPGPCPCGRRQKGG